jgi:hypothetical protein
MDEFDFVDRKLAIPWPDLELTKQSVAKIYEVF